MAKTLILIISLNLLSLFSLSSPLPSQTLVNAVELLSNSGFVAMSLTLELVSPTLIPLSPSATIFAPSDAAFAASGQPPLSLLQFHFSPLAFSPESLQSLPFETKIPTMFTGHSLIVTSWATNNQFSLNNVTVNVSPIYDDGSLIIFGIEKFFDPYYQVSAPIQSPSSDLGCVMSTSYPKPMSSSGVYSFDEACGMLRSRGYSVMASFLDLQLLGFRDQTTLTVFAPVDEVMMEHVGNYSEYSSIFLRHVLHCKLSWTDLVNFNHGTMLQTSLEGFTINITRSGDMLMLNDVPLTFPDMYYGDWLVVHGLREILTVPEKPERAVESSSEIRSNDAKASPDRGEF